MRRLHSEADPPRGIADWIIDSDLFWCSRRRERHSRKRNVFADHVCDSRQTGMPTHPIVARTVCTVTVAALGA
jgi:hypothetical protein